MHWANINPYRDVSQELQAQSWIINRFDNYGTINIEMRCLGQSLLAVTDYLTYAVHACIGAAALARPGC